MFVTDYSAAVGTPAAGESWEVGVPGPGDVATGLALAFTTVSAEHKHPGA
jgi:hypothetical protein